MIANMSHGGKIAMLGIPPDEISIDWNDVIFNMGIGLVVIVRSLVRKILRMASCSFDSKGSRFFSGRCLEAVSKP
ncbi:hypothetical protein AB1L30_00345 [Bremerella sp. JC817]|uniref:hypothetical protein n=1 Tax=Bremerella sp. JC817 TaxID=3231756 RepID=UPI003459AC4B